MKQSFTLLLLALSCSLMAQLGTIDSSFGTNGFVVYDASRFQQWEYFSRAFVGDDDKLYLGGQVGTAQTGNIDFIFVRLHDDGRLDSTFGYNGIARFDPSIGAHDFFYDMAPAPGGKFVAVGSNSGQLARRIVARFLPSGELDTSFAHTGLIIGTPGEFMNLYSCLVEDDGSILLGGSQYDQQAVQRPMLYKLKPNGQVDSSFGYNGFMMFPPQEEGVVWKIHKHQTNRYYLLNYPCIRAFNASGQLDGTFGAGGCASYEVQDHPYGRGLTTTPDGKVLFSGFRAADSLYRYTPWVMRFNANGSPDNSFGVGGTFHAQLAGNYKTQISPPVLLADGSMFFPGGEMASDSEPLRAITTMLVSDGTIYSSYGTNGTKSYEVPGSDDDLASVIISDGNGGYYLAGYTVQNGQLDLFVAKLKGEQSPSAVEYAPESHQMSLYPNPTKTGEPVTFTWTAPATGTLQVQVFDITGQCVHRETHSTAPGSQRYQIDLSTHLSKGLYTVHVYQGAYSGIQKLLIH